MEEFKKDLLRMCKRNIAAPIIFLVLAVICAGLGALMSDTSYDPFDGTSGGYQQLDVVYVMGPFAERTEDGRTNTEYYIAEDADGYWNIIGTDTYNDLPVYGEDVSDEDIENLTPQTVIGYSSTIPYELGSYLVDYFEGTGADVTMSNYTDYFGSYYLDTTDKNSDGDSMFFYIAALMMAILGLVTFFAEGARKKKVKKQIEQMEQDGTIIPVFNDFSAGPRFFYNKTKVALSRRYLLDFNSTGHGFDVIPLENIVNVFKCNMVSGEPTSTSYIALETASGERYLAAASEKAGQEFDNVIMQIRKSSDGGQVW